ncbi:hypothetical protein D3C79_911890 [compost metagenome]|jgi:hypothetical protein
MEIASRTGAGHIEFIACRSRESLDAAPKIEVPVSVAQHNARILEMVHAFARSPIERIASVLVTPLVEELHDLRVGMTERAPERTSN